MPNWFHLYKSWQLWKTNWVCASFMSSHSYVQRISWWRPFVPPAPETGCSQKSATLLVGFCSLTLQDSASMVGRTLGDAGKPSTLQPTSSSGATASEYVEPSADFDCQGWLPLDLALKDKGLWVFMLLQKVFVSFDPGWSQHDHAHCREPGRVFAAWLVECNSAHSPHWRNVVTPRWSASIGSARFVRLLSQPPAANDPIAAGNLDIDCSEVAMKLLNLFVDTWSNLWVPFSATHFGLLSQAMLQAAQATAFFKPGHPWASLDVPLTWETRQVALHLAPLASLASLSRRRRSCWLNSPLKKQLWGLLE